MNREELIRFCLELGNTACDYPFEMDDNNCVARHMANKKWFALISEKDGWLCVNLKCDPAKADFLRGLFRDVIPAYHMNKTHWNTVWLNGDVPEPELLLMIEHSYDLTKPRIRRKGK